MNAIKTSLVKIILSILAVSVVATAGVFYFVYPSRSIMIDVNPSIELKVNRLNKVMSVVGVNDDAKKLLEKHKPSSTDLNVVIDNIIDSMVEEKYISADKKNDVLITSGKDTASKKTLSEVGTQVIASLEQREMATDILMQSVEIDKATAAQAEKHQVSAGKMAVIEQLVSGDSTLTAETLSTTRISDIVEYAKQKNMSLDLLEQNIDTIKKSLKEDAPNAESMEAVLDAMEEKIDDAEDASQSQEDKADSDKDDSDDKDDDKDDDDKDDKDDDDKDDKDDDDDDDDKVTDKPANSGSTADKPANSGSTADKPANSGSTADKPANSGSTADKPANSDSTADKPANSDSTTDKPVASTLTVDSTANVVTPPQNEEDEPEDEQDEQDEQEEQDEEEED